MKLTKIKGMKIMRNALSILLVIILFLVIVFPETKIQIGLGFISTVIVLFTVLSHHKLTMLQTNKQFKDTE